MSALRPTLPFPAPSRRARARARAGAAASASSSSSASVGVGVGVGASLYEVLGVAEGEGRAEEIKRAYRRMARRLHPDVAASPPARAAAEFIAVRRAYDTLSDPARRALYDRSRLTPHHELDERSHWRKQWQDQIAELYWRSINKDSEDNLSWGARMRRKRGESLN